MHQRKNSRADLPGASGILSHQTTRPRMSTTTKKKSKREKRYEEASALLEHGLGRIQRDPERMRQYLAFRAHFHQYSFQNALLIQEQLSGARFCKGYRKWQNVGRQVQKGESGLLIFVPFVRKVRTQEEADDKGKEIGEKALFGFGTGYVFDISQTEPIEDFEGDVLTYVSPVAELQGTGFTSLYDDLRRVAGQLSYDVCEYAGAPYQANGYCTPGGEIGIRTGADRSPNAKARTLAHEVIHAQAHMSETARKEHSPAERELQAEGAAFLFCYLLGFDTSEYSFPYLQSWEGENETLKAQLVAVEGLAFNTLDLLDQARS